MYFHPAVASQYSGLNFRNSYKGKKKTLTLTSFPLLFKNLSEYDLKYVAR